MPIAVGEQYRFAESSRQRVQAVDHGVEPGATRIGGRQFEPHVGLHQDDHTGGLLRLGESEALLEPGEIGGQPVPELGHAIGPRRRHTIARIETAPGLQAIAAANDMDGYEHDAIACEARVLGKLDEAGLVGLRVHGKRPLAQRSARIRIGQTMEGGKSLKWIEPACRRKMAVSPLVVAGGQYQRGPHTAQLLEP